MTRAEVPPVLALRSVCKRFAPRRSLPEMLHLRAPATVEVLDSVSLEVGRGSVVCLMGSNGSGKTTLLRLCAGVLLLDEGTVTVCGADPARRPAVRRGVGLLSSSERSFYWRLSARRNLLFWGSLQGLAGRRLRAAVDRAVAVTECAGLMDSRFEDLSTGMRQRVGLARAIIHRPGLILLDEPTRSMDAESAESFARLICRLAADGAAVVMATHSAAEAAELGQRTLRLEDGCLREVDAGYSKGPAVQVRFLGSPSGPPPGPASVAGDTLRCPAFGLRQALEWLEREGLRIVGVHSCGGDP